MTHKTKAYWDLLRQLRQNFLTEKPVTQDYWSDLGQIAAYDESFGERIAWKWHAVLNELSAIGWVPAHKLNLIDWGCGTGIASRMFIQHPIGSLGVEAIFLHDRSFAAQKFAEQRLNQHQTWRGEVYLKLPETLAQPAGLLLSHVLTELPERGLNELLKVAEKCQFILAVEPGTKEASTKLVSLRDSLLLAGWHPIAPCTHTLPCPAARSPKHWCHRFASPPQEVAHSSYWREFSRQLRIDLRALPYSYVLLERKDLTPINTASRKARVLGRPRMHKTHTQALICNEAGLQTFQATTRKNPIEFQKLRDEDAWL